MLTCAAPTAWVAAGGGGASASTFVNLSDTPCNYNGAADKLVKVTSDELGLEFTTIPAHTHVWINVCKSGSSVNDLGDVNTTGALNGCLLCFNGAAWIPATQNPGVEVLDDLCDVDTTGEAAGCVLCHNGTCWVVGTAAGGGGAYLPLTGGTMCGHVLMDGYCLDMCGGSILNVGPSSICFNDGNKLISCRFGPSGNFIICANELSNNYLAQAPGDTATAGGKCTCAAGCASTVFGELSNAIGAHSFAAGYHSSACGAASISMGCMATAVSDHGMSFGYNAYSCGEGAIALGQDSNASGCHGIAIGKGSCAREAGPSPYWSYATAIGNDAEAVGAGAIALGQCVLAQGQGAVALGNSSVACGTNSFSQGGGCAIASGVVFGACSFACCSQGFAISSGRAESYDSFAGAGGTTCGPFSFSFGTDSCAATIYSFAFGAGAQATGERAVAIGQQACASGTYSAALTGGARATGSGSVALGTASGADGDYSIALGRNACVSGENSVMLSLCSNTSNLAQDNTFAIMHGFVGIGTITPSTELDVIGAVRASGGFESGAASGITCTFDTCDGLTVHVCNGIVYCIA